jgi:alpha-tubulin suppressor-like RCC1 family protein
MPGPNIKVNGISCGFSHCLMWDMDGAIYTWGDGGEGKLGLGCIKGNYHYQIVNPTQVNLI